MVTNKTPLTADEGGELVGVPGRTVRYWCDRGRAGRTLPHTRGVRGQVLVERSDLLDFVRTTHPPMPAAAVAGK